MAKLTDFMLASPADLSASEVPSILKSAGVTFAVQHQNMMKNADLERLQEHLFTIYDICQREGIELGEAHAELLSSLWTRLGGNRRTRRRNEMHIELLKEVGRYRKEALTHVVVTRDVLQALAADVEELRASAAAPEIVGDSVPPEVLIRSIGSQIERLKEGKQRASERQQAMMNRMLAAPDDVFSTEDE